MTNTLRRMWLAGIIAWNSLCVRSSGGRTINGPGELLLVAAPFGLLAILLLVPMTVLAIRDAKGGTCLRGRLRCG